MTLFKNGLQKSITQGFADAFNLPPSHFKSQYRTSKSEEKGLAASPEQIKQYKDLIKKSLVPAGYCELSLGLNLEKFILDYCQK